jgi:Skp family chaperone for outer membrane proteins
MRGDRHFGWLGVIAAAFLAASHLPVLAQAEAGSPAAGSVVVLTLDRERMFADSRFGKSSMAAIDDSIRALQSENRQIEADLETEERALTEQRKQIGASEFRALADAFDAKVKGIRVARDAKGRELAAQQDTARQQFLKAAIPILAKIMAEQGATIIIDRSATILSFDRVDITDLAIARIDAELVGAEPPADQPPAEGDPLAPPGPTNPETQGVPGPAPDATP